MVGIYNALDDFNTDLATITSDITATFVIPTALTNDQTDLSTRGTALPNDHAVDAAFDATSSHYNTYPF